MSVRINNGYVITANAQNACMEGCVIVDGGIIVYAGSEALAPDMDVARTIDANSYNFV